MYFNKKLELLQNQCVLTGEKREKIMLFDVLNFCVYDQYSKTEPTYAQYDCLFIYLCLLVHLPF
jgi:hypothetical protein